MKRFLTAAAMLLLAICAGAQTDYGRYVNPAIGEDGGGCCAPGPSRPFAMIKPSINCGPHTGSGWRPAPEPVDGFGQVHMTGAGGGPKYGNIMIQPFTGALDATSHRFNRELEEASLGYYAVTYRENGIKTAVSSTEHAAIYQICYPEGARKSLSVDCGFFLGVWNPVDSTEAQNLVGSEIEILSDHEIQGYSRVRGGWNRSPAYTVFFYLISDTPFSEMKTWKADAISSCLSQYDEGKPTGALVSFDNGSDEVNLKIGVSYLSCLKARNNVREEVPHWSLERTVNESREVWETLFSHVEIDPTTPDSLKTMFYTGLYHTMMHPTDKTGECPLWNDNAPYFDDYFALWDTYRTSFPMFNLVYPELSSKMLQSMLMIYRRQGYVPDARSSHWNGRTQGGSNANIVFADAYLKGIKGVDWELALESALKDADVPPGDNEEQHGRGGLKEYNTLGYVPYGIARSCSRTVDYSICDYAIASLAKELGHDDIASRFFRQSGNWKNLWRDYEEDGVRGFVMPRKADGEWLVNFHTDKSDVNDLPVTAHYTLGDEIPYAGYYWGTSFYEGTSWQYSLAVPHDVPGLIEKCGGAKAFENRLDTFFGHNYFDVSNEPSFIIPVLYHWIGKPWKSSDCVRERVISKFNTSPAGIPGNDDTGEMSSWLVFHMMGLYPVAGQDLYLIYSPLLAKTTLHLPGGDFTIVAEKLSDKNRYIQSATLNGEPYPYSSLNHASIASGGTLVLKMGPKPSSWGAEMQP